MGDEIVLFVSHPRTRVHHVYPCVRCNHDGPNSHLSFERAGTENSLAVEWLAPRFLLFLVFRRPCAQENASGQHSYTTRQDISSRNHRLRDGLRLFEAAISLEIVYVAGAWSGLEDVAKASPINTDEPETHHQLQKDVQKKNKKGVCEEDVRDETKKGSQHTWNPLEL